MTNGVNAMSWANAPSPSAPFSISAASNNPASVIQGNNTASSGSGIRGQTSSTSLSYGVVGEELSAHVDSAGVAGFAGSPGIPNGLYGGNGIGVIGANGTSGVGVYGYAVNAGGIAMAAQGNAMGLSVTASAPTGRAIHAEASTSNNAVEVTNHGTGIGLFVQGNGPSSAFAANNANGDAVVGKMGDTALAAGVKGVDTGGMGNQIFGVWGYGTSGNKGNVGVLGTIDGASIPATFPKAVGVAGLNDNVSGWGVYAEAAGSGSIALVAEGKAMGISVTTQGTTSADYAIVARSNAPGAVIRGQTDNSSGLGVQGIGFGTGSGIYGTVASAASGSIGVQGANAAAGGIGVFGSSTNASGYGVEAINTVASGASTGAALYVNGTIRTNFLNSTFSASDPAHTATLNAASGSIGFPAGGGAWTSLTVTDSFVTPNSVVIVTFAHSTIGSTGWSVTIPPAGGSFTVTSAVSQSWGSTSKLNFVIIN